MHLFLNTHEKTKPNVRSTGHEDNTMGIIDDIQKRPIGYVSIVSLSSTIPNGSTDNTAAARPKFGLSSKRHHHRLNDIGK